MTEPHADMTGIWQRPAPCWTLVKEADGESPYFEGMVYHELTEDAAFEALRKFRADEGELEEGEQRDVILVIAEENACWQATARCGTEFVYHGDDEQSHFTGRDEVRDRMEESGWTGQPDGSWLCDQENCATCRPDLDPLLVPVPQVDGQQPLGWYDERTGLVTGPICEPAYPKRCQHCDQNIRLMPGGDFYTDPNGFTSCRKDLPHHPLPEVSRA
jgi:hypothetical protein